MRGVMTVYPTVQPSLEYTCEKSTLTLTLSPRERENVEMTSHDNHEAASQ